MTTNNSDQSLPEQLDLGSSDIAADQREKLRKLFPEVFTEGGKVDFDRLKATLGEIVDTGPERYGMNWPGKSECFRTIQAPSRATLRPCREESVNFDTTENLIIEGDNLEVLKLLQKGYLGKVKMIYIDPPYNTGNDFIYPDNYTESLETYLSYTGQVNAERKKFSTNPETDGRFHSKWMNMMYPRLFLARNLLREDGVIFISIDDNECDNLRKLCSELYGEENFMATFIWKRRQNVDSRSKNGASVDHEYVLCFHKSENGQIRGAEKYLGKYSNPDNDPRGDWMSADMTGLATIDQRPNLHYDLKNPVTGIVYQCPSTGWRYEPKRMNELINNDEILFPSKPDGRPRRKKFVRDLESEFTGLSSILDTVFNTQGTRELRTLFDDKEYFDFPKPKALLVHLIEQGTIGEGDIILDFFAGSGTTAQAILEQNKKDGGNRKFILVQLPEPTGREEYKTIADITKERVRRVINKMNNKDDGKLDLQSGAKQDRGFRVFKLDTSNFRPWDGTQPENPDGVVKQLELHIDHVLPDRSQADILTEILLKSGFPLSTKVEIIELANKQVFSIEHGAMLVCLEDNLTSDVIKAMADMKPERVICLDAGFQGNDQLKTNAVQTMKARGVVKFQTV